jgi:integrase
MCRCISPRLKRQRLFFATKLEAESEAELLKTRQINFGHSLNTMSPERIAEAAACYERLELACPGATLGQAVVEFVAFQARRTTSVPMRTLFDSFLEAKKEANPNYTRQLRNVFGRVAVLNDVIVRDLEPQQIETALKGFPDGNRNAALRYLRASFNHGIRRGWLTENPVRRLEFKKRIRDSVEVISPATVKKLLVDALAKDLELVPFLVLTFYAGVRPDGEVQELVWSDIDLTAKKHHVTIRPSVAKKRRKRWIDLSENALAWLHEYSVRGGKMEGKIGPFSASTLRRKRRKNATAAGLSSWPQQGARHTYCSCWLREHGDINKLVLQAGHESPQVMWNHYYQAVTPEASAAFWAIYPPASQAHRIVSLAA